MNTQARIVAIVPRLPPSIDGVGDYALHLARQLRQDSGLITDFLVGDPDWNGETSVEEFAVERVALRSPRDLLKLLPNESKSPATVLLHYVGYGYARRGCPVWLVEGLERWRKAGENRRLVTMFHEVYAFGPIWTSAFWTSPLQQSLAKRLANLSDFCLTSKQKYAEIISRISQGKHSKIPALPVFSTVGEPEYLSPLAERQKRLVVFGGRGPRSRVYLRSRLALERTCQELEIEEIIDIGPSLGFEIEPIRGIAVDCLGIKTAQEISSLLSTSLVGFFNYHPEFLAKSTIFAAYCAHNLLPVGGFYEGENVDGLEAGKHYFFIERSEDSICLPSGQKIADDANLWYQKHKLSVQSKTFANFLLNG